MRSRLDSAAAFKVSTIVSSVTFMPSLTQGDIQERYKDMFMSLSTDLQRVIFILPVL
jgi:hypothetical protein